MSDPKKIFITTGGMRSGKTLYQEMVYELLHNPKYDAMFRADANEIKLDGMTIVDSVKKIKEFFDMHPKTDDKFTFETKLFDCKASGLATIRLEHTEKFKIKDVIVNHPATIVLWGDGTKTVVKCDNEEFDLEKAIAMAFARKALGNKYDYYNVFKKWLKKARVIGNDAR